MSLPEARLRLRMWLEMDGEQALGLGRAILLREVERQGSLNKAAKALGMSYRAAWGRLKKTEEVLGEHLVVEQEKGRGFTLTPHARELVEAFQEWYADVEAYAVRTAQNRFPFPVAPFESEEP
ncbi:putative transcriptional regulator, ModE family [Desulfovibrio sp. X2]|uniref:winged helix-turn-helix domain-containing protein n=1 Tax=Desulfovibrio sp. X2 TaxID=941449 RepID=UPI000358799F|nr:LysR family transcriptional regulator [Desulfovibrio sp. X2]EPR44519.1 putative transcriptional regulator, ModE family [Desulfovibrio sp. X2]